MIRQRMKTAFVLMMAVAMVATSVPTQAQTAVKAAVKRTKQSTTTKANETKAHNYAEGEAIIMYKNAASTAKKSAGKSFGSDIEIVETYTFEKEAVISAKSSTLSNGVAVSLVKSDKYSTEELISILKKRSDVKYAEPNYKIKTVDTDPYKKLQWALDNQGQNGGTTGFDINADTQAMQNVINSDEKVIALIDTGIDYTHEDLADVVWNNPINSKQLKGLHGYDFINMDTDPLDDNGHGTHCSGIMAATADNGKGIAGVANDSNIKIMGLKILDAEGYGYGMEAIGAYNYVYKAQQLGVNVVAVNNSWGGYADDDEESQIMTDIINLVGKAGALSVCAAGNEALDNEGLNVIPAGIESPYVISVAASNENDELAAFSNYGNNVDIAAPGTDILSSVSYNVFNPVLYDNKDEFCAAFEDFESGNPVQVMKKGKMLDDVTVGSDDIAYGFSSTGKATMEVTVSEGTYFGADGNKSLQWTITGAKAGDEYVLYLPYTAEESSTALYSSVATKVCGPVATDEGEAGESIIYAMDSTIDENGAYDTDSEEFIGGAYVDSGNYWSFHSNVAAESVSEQQSRAMAVELMVDVAGDYTVHIDKMGVSKPGIEADAFGKYDFYNGTSMATPYVTGAVAAVANSYADETTLERRGRVVGSVRKSESLKGKVKSGGVLDLSRAGNPYMSVVSALLNDKKQIEISGYYLTGATVQIDDKDVATISGDETSIVVDGSQYLNKYITLKVTKGDDVIEERCFFMTGKNFNQMPVIEGVLDNGAMTTDGNNLYYVDGTGVVSVGTLYEMDKKEQLGWISYWNEYKPAMFGDSYKNVVDYTITNRSEVVCLNKTLYAMVSIDVGYAEDSILAYYDFDKGWQKYADLPEEVSDLSGVTLTAYDGKLYLIGGFDESTGTASKQVKYYNASKKTWTKGIELPEARCFSQARQVGTKLVLTLGGDGKGNVPKNLIFNGSKWTVSKSVVGNIIDTAEYLYGDNEEYSLTIANAQIGMVKDGIVYTNLRVEGIGDTFTYRLSSDKYEASGYCLNTAVLDGNQFFATTMQNKMYVLYGWGYEEDDDLLILWKNSTIQASDDFSNILEDLLGDEDSKINVCSMPIDSGFVYVKDNSKGEAYVDGAGYYLPGDMITLTAKTYDEGPAKSLTVNGKAVSPDKKGVYTYSQKAKGDVYNITAAAAAEDYKWDFGDDITKGMKVTVGKFTYKVTSFTSNKKEVSCIKLNNKSSKTAKVPAAVTIEGYKFKVTAIGTKAFKGCKKLKKVTIGKNVTSIGKKAFMNCKKLTKVTIKSKKIKKFGKNLFKGTNKKLKVKVPKKYKKTYGKKLKKAGFKGTVK